MFGKAILLFACLTVCLAVSGSSAAQPSLPWYMTGHFSVVSSNGGAASMPYRLRKAVGRQLTQASAACTPKWTGKTYIYWNMWKKIGIKVVLFKYTEKVAYCVDGTNVTYFYRIRYFEIPPLPVIDHVAQVNLWSFEGNIDSGYDCPGPPGTDAAEHCYDPSIHQQTRLAMTRGSFQACLIKICNHRYPVIGIIVVGDGSVRKQAVNG
jgi:hypothetical protein